MMHYGLMDGPRIGTISTCYPL